MEPPPLPQTQTVLGFDLRARRPVSGQPFRPSPGVDASAWSSYLQVGEQRRSLSPRGTPRPEAAEDGEEPPEAAEDGEEPLEAKTNAPCFCFLLKTYKTASGVDTKEHRLTDLLTD